MFSISHRLRLFVVGVLIGTLTSMAAACFGLRKSSGGGQTEIDPTRVTGEEDVLLPDGYKIEAVAGGLTFPTGVAFDAQNRPHLVESGYSYGEAWASPRLLRLNADGSITELVHREKNGPWNGVAFSNNAFYVAEGGQLEGGRILRVTVDGQISPIIDSLPSQGDHHTNGPAVGRDGWIYFGQGTATNSGVVGQDNFDFGWLSRVPEFHDIPAKDITLAGTNFTATNPFNQRLEETTGAFVPFGTATTSGQVIRGALPCTGAIMRVKPDGSDLELVAWGLRNPFGLAFSPQGDLYCTENGFDERGSRPVFGTGDHLWRIEPGLWYGWPDYSGGIPLNKEYENHGHDDLSFLLAEHPNEPPRPTAIFAVHSSSNGLDFSRSSRFGYEGQAFVAQFGDMAPPVGKVLGPVGFKVVRVEVDRGVIHDFAVNRGDNNGPASKLKVIGLERPVAVRFDNTGDTLYVVDFGIMNVTDQGPIPQPETGVLWRIFRIGDGGSANE